MNVHELHAIQGLLGYLNEHFTTDSVLVLFMLPGTCMALGDTRRYKQLQGRYQAGLEDIRREVRLAFANSEIDQDKMINALNRLYDAGVTPEKDAPLPREIRALDSYGKEG